MKVRSKKKKKQKPRQPGLAPGTPVFIGDQKLDKPIVTLIQFNEKQRLGILLTGMM
jgi:hypothetical protein